MGEWILQQSYYLGMNASAFWHDVWFVIMGFLIFFFFILPLILAVAYLTLWERKVLAWSHYRLGPNRAGWMGLLQPLCDAVKLLIKEDIVPVKADWVVWFLAPLVAFGPMVACFLAIPMSNAEVIINVPNLATGETFPSFTDAPMIGADLGIGLLFIISLSSLVVIGIFTAGFGSNNKYSMFGAVRSAGQIISYEVPVILSLLTVVLLTGSLSTVSIVKAQKFIPPSDMNTLLEIDYIRSKAVGFNRNDTSNWAAMYQFLQSEKYEQTTKADDMSAVWRDYKSQFDSEYQSLPKARQDEVSINGQSLYLKYNDYEKTAGSPRLPFIIPLLIGFLVYFIAGVAETNRSPFDLPEGESEIVAGFHTEYTGIKFGLFFLGEYGNMILISAIGVTCFLGGYLGPAIPGMDAVANFVGQYFYYFAWFFIKVFILVSVMVWFRATFPRVRIDQLTDFAWKVLLPIAVLNLLIVGYFHFSDWNLVKMGETNWILWYGNFMKPFQYPAVRMLILMIFIPIVSDILYPYRKVIQPRFLYAEITFIIGFMGHEIFTYLFGNKTIELVLMWIFYVITIGLCIWMYLDVRRARQSGTKFIPAIAEDDSVPDESSLAILGKQSVNE